MTYKNWGVDEDLDYLKVVHVFLRRSNPSRAAVHQAWQAHRPDHSAAGAALERDSSFFDYSVTRRHLELLRGATDARGRPLQIVTLETSSQVRPAFAGNDFAAGYVNFLLTDKALLLPEFGDAAPDRAARSALAAQLPSHQIVQIDIDAIAAGGGGIHCTTQQEPA